MFLAPLLPALSAMGSAVMSAMPYITAGMTVLQAVSQSKSEAYNAKVAKVEGQQAQVNAQAEADRQRAINAQKQGQAIANAGAQGTTLEGSPALAFLQNARQGEVEAQDLLYGGRMKKTAADREAEMLKRKSENSLWGGIAGAGMNLFSSMNPSSSTVLTGSNTTAGGYAGVGSTRGGVWSPSNYTLS